MQVLYGILTDIFVLYPLLITFLGAQVNERTNHGKGGNALWWAEKKQTKQHKQTAAILKKYGGVKLAPKGKKD